MINLFVPLSVTSSGSNLRQTKYLKSTPSPDKYISHDTISLSFKGAGQSKAEIQAAHAEDYFFQLITESKATEAQKREAKKRYDKAKKNADKSKAIKETVRWMSAVSGAGAGFFATGDPTIATSVGVVLAATSDHLGVALANLCQALGYPSLSPFFADDDVHKWAIAPC